MKLHLGCGKRYLKNFVHVDYSNYDHIDFIADVSNLNFIESETVDEIYSSHTLEYFDFEESFLVMKEWKRTLKPGGKIYIAVPDFDSLIKIYDMTGKDITKIRGPLFGKWLITQKETFLYHKSFWNFHLLEDLMLRTGFENVNTFNPFEYLNTVDPEYDDYSLAFYPHFDKNGIQVSLCLTGIKTS